MASTKSMTFAAYFQCCRPDVAQDGTAARSFLETAELVRSFMTGQGYNVERIYTTSTAYHSNPAKSELLRQRHTQHHAQPLLQRRAAAGRPACQQRLSVERRHQRRDRRHQRRPLPGLPPRPRRHQRLGQSRASDRAIWPR